VKPDTRSFYEAAVERAIARIARALDEALDLEVIAREAALSPFHFHRIFRGMVGETPVEMHRRLRLERAARQLVASDTAVVSIAFDAGYETHEAFTRAFRRAYGASPTGLREQAETSIRPLQLSLAARSGIHFPPASPLVATFVTGEATMNVTIETRPALRVATVRHVGPYQRISEAFARLGELAGAARLLPPPRPAMIAIYHDDPDSTPPEQLRSDAGLIVPEDAALPPGLVEHRLPAGRWARTTHEGPYDLLGDTWSRFMGDWLPKSGHRVGPGSSYELYLNTPENAAPGELRTELYLSLELDWFQPGSPSPSPSPSRARARARVGETYVRRPWLADVFTTTVVKISPGSGWGSGSGST
jgi:AraC family transcriptional regulator